MKIAELLTTMGLATGSAACLAVPAMAATPLTRTVSTTSNPTPNTSTLSTTASEFSSISTTPVTTISAQPIRLGKFDTGTGILVGATVGLSGVNTRSSVRVSGTISGSTGSGRNVEATTKLTGSVSGTGFNFTNAEITASRACNAGNCSNGSSNGTSTVAGGVLSGTTAITAANLAAYAGAGSVALNRSATGTATAQNGAHASSGTAVGFYTFTGGTYSIAYDYLNFASPSFSGNSLLTSLDLDLGTARLGSGPVTLNFTLFNIGNANSAGLGLGGITRDNNDASFSSTVSTFTNLAGGNSVQYSLTFDPTVAGLHQDRFRFALADFAPGGVGGRSYSLDLGVTGIATAVPEPATWATLLVGFALVGASTRRRRTNVVAA